MENLYKKLKKYNKRKIYPMHMPGHKRKRGICAKIDITEIDGFDNLANPTGILKKISDKASRLYGADKAYISVNGSTGAILSAILALCQKGDKIIMARNCHKSVYNAVELMELDASYIFPNYDENGIAEAIEAEAVKQAIDENPNARLIILTSPTYEGVISDIKAVSNVAHTHNIPVFVDSAHGAHLKFMNMPNPIEEGSDAVAVSLHKTLPSLTQTALLLSNGEKDFQDKINMFQTSSPSYVLMASIDSCLDYVKNGNKFEKYAKNLNNFYKKAERLKKLKVRADKTADKGKIVILTSKTDISGKELTDILRTKYKIELEMAYDNYALAMTSVCDGKKALKRLYKALFEIDKSVKSSEKRITPYPKPQKAEQIFNGKAEYVDLEKSQNRICAEFIWAYPPGVPIIAKGEIIDKETIDYLLSLDNTALYGKNGLKNNKILVI